MDFQVIKAETENDIDLGFIHSCLWQKIYQGIIEDNIVDELTPEKRAAVFT